MAMTNDFNFAVSIEGLDEKGKIIEEQFKVIEDAVTDIDDAVKYLDTWQSKNKEMYAAKIKEALPKMHEMAQVVQSYGNVARLTAARLQSVENKIRNSIESNA